MAHTDIIEMTDADFESKALQSVFPVVVDFWAPWCGPCKMLGPIVEDLAGEYKGKVVFGKVNIDNSPRTASHYGIVSIPTMLFIRNGKVVDQHVGLLPKPALKSKVDAFLAGH